MLVVTKILKLFDMDNIRKELILPIEKAKVEKQRSCKYSQVVFKTPPPQIKKLKTTALINDHSFSPDFCLNHSTENHSPTNRDRLRLIANYN